MTITTALREELAAVGMSMDRFRELTTRLLSYGVVVRDEDRTEQAYYDDIRKVETLLSEYLEVAGMYLHHNLDNQFFRLYAPGAVVDGVAEDPNEPVPALKARVSANFVAAALTLRFLYQEKLNQGYIDTQGEALVTFEDVAAALQTHLKRSLPEGANERMSLLAELKRHRLLRYSSNFSITDEDTYLAIRPTILGVVSNEALAMALEADGVIESDEPTERTGETEE
jgi:ribosomal protein S15P/S13E